MAKQVWFITGSTRGFGRALILAALDAGDLVVATARRPEQLSELQKQYGDRIFPTALDVTDPDAARVAIDKAVTHFGRVDVIVNNAGYANIAPVETAPEDDFRRQFDTNFWGVYNVTKAALPVLRKQGSGIVIQFSSIGGRVGGAPGLGSYQAAKFAVDGFTRVLASETAPFGIRYIVIEPGGFATDWAGASMEIQDIPSEYDATVGAMARIMGTQLTQAGDPWRAAEIIVRVAKRKNLPSHLVLGKGAVSMALAYSNNQIAEATAWQKVSASGDFGEEYPVEFPADRPTK